MSQEKLPSPQPPPTTTTTTTPTRRSEDPFSPRSLKQLSLLVLGSAFFLTSIGITRRSVARKQIAAFPKFYQTNSRTGAAQAAAAAGGGDLQAQGGIIAVQALGLATLNVFSFAVMCAGGVSYAADISSMDEFRQYARRRMYGPGGKSDEEAEKELEEWAASVLSRIGKLPTKDEEEKKDR